MASDSEEKAAAPDEEESAEGWFSSIEVVSEPDDEYVLTVYHLTPGGQEALTVKGDGFSRFKVE